MFVSQGALRRLAIWRRVSPSGSGVAPSDNAKIKPFFACFGCAWYTRL